MLRLNIVLLANVVGGSRPGNYFIPSSESKLS